MSGYLWKAFLEDDIKTFRLIFENATFISHTIQKGKSITSSSSINIGTSNSINSINIGSPRSLESNTAATTTTTTSPHYHQPTNIILTRNDLNYKDQYGRTLLHLISTSKLESASSFAKIILDQPLVDIYIQDFESGWTSLHRAFYHGNITIAILTLQRDSRDTLQASNLSSHSNGGLIKIKDHEGNTPFDLLEQTLNNFDNDSNINDNISNISSETDDIPVQSANSIDQGLYGHEVYTFGSNKNLTLGFGDEDDRQYPERVSIQQPKHLLDHRLENYTSLNTNAPLSNIPPWIQYKPTLIHDVIMGKYSSAIITNDPCSNLHICGHGSNGRLGLGDERTRFQFTCLETNSFGQKKVLNISLGHHHTLALTEDYELYSWGNNKYGQLGYTVPLTSSSKEPIQLVPRQIFGPLKREKLLGIATSSIHSVVHTIDTLWTFGKNEGQLGIIDSDARSLDIQIIPRKVASTKLHCHILSICAIDKATICLFSDHEIRVFTNYGYSKLSFPSQALSNFSSKTCFDNEIIKVNANGDTICALSKNGLIYSTQVLQSSNQPKNSSTTNPSKIKSSLSPTKIIWNNRKSHLDATDISVDQNGDIVLVTKAGSVWKKVKRAKINLSRSASNNNDEKPKGLKDYKFTRVPGIISAISVKASGFGAYAIVRKEDRITENLEDIDRFITLDHFELCGFNYSSVLETPYVHKWHKQKLSSQPAFYFDWSSNFHETIAQCMITFDRSLDFTIETAFKDGIPLSNSKISIFFCSTSSDIEIPCPLFLLTAASPVFRQEFASNDPLISIPQDFVNGNFKLQVIDEKLYMIFNDSDIISIFMLWYYLASGVILPLQKAVDNPLLAARLRKCKMELLKLSHILEIDGLEERAKSRTSMIKDSFMERFFLQKPFDPSILKKTDIIIKLKDGQIKAHSNILCQRCPFFDALFNGRSQGKWLSDRRSQGTDDTYVDLSHIYYKSFMSVLKWVYFGSMQCLVSLETKDVDDYIDELLEIINISNELMIEQLASKCQQLLGYHVTVRNVGYILDAIAPCEVSGLKDACLRYMLLHFEAVLRHGQCEELHEDILLELDSTAREIQSSNFPISKSGLLDVELLERNPDLKNKIHQEKQAKIDSILILNKYSEFHSKGASSFRAGSLDQYSNHTPIKPKRRRSSQLSSPSSSPVLQGQHKQINDMIFQMDDEKFISEFGKLTSPVLVFDDELTLNQHHDKDSDKDNDEDMDNDKHHQHTPDPSDFLSKSSSQGIIKGWNFPSTHAVQKLSMKDILNQTYINRTSNPTNTLQEVPNKTRRPSNTPKLSQKERKKLHHQSSLFNSTKSDLVVRNNELLTETYASSSSPPPPPPPLPRPLPSSSSSSSSPWKTIEKPKAKDLLTLATPTTAVTITPHLTMRQTVANPNSKYLEQNFPTKSKSVPIITPSSSKITQPSTSNPTCINPSTSRSSPVQIKSIRHTPMPVRSRTVSEQSKMMDILCQQQAEKVILQGGGEKPNLIDIQTEQAFQEWWDKESAKIQDEEKEKEDQSKSKFTKSREHNRRRQGITNRGNKGNRGNKESKESKESPNKKTGYNTMS